MNVKPDKNQTAVYLANDPSAEADALEEEAEGKTRDGARTKRGKERHGALKQSEKRSRIVNTEKKRGELRQERWAFCGEASELEGVENTGRTCA
jgi:hypothetical protein